MPRSVKVTLDGQEFEVPAMNIDQLEQVSELTSKAEVVKAGQLGLKILRVAMDRATPKPDYATLAPTVDECGDVVRKIMTMSGLQKPDANPPT